MAETTLNPSPTQNLGNYAAMGLGAVVPSIGVTVQETMWGPLHLARFTFINMPVAIADQTTNGAWGGTKFFTFPIGRIVPILCLSSCTFTTTSDPTTTLNTSKANVEWGIGSAVAGAVLATTAMDYLPGTGQTTLKFTSSSAQNVASAAATGALVTASTAQFDGTATAAVLYFNIGVTAANNADIDGNATVTVNGYSNLVYFHGGDY